MLLLPLFFFCFLTFTATISTPGVSPLKSQRPAIKRQIPEDDCTPKNFPRASPVTLDDLDLLDLEPTTPDPVDGKFVDWKDPQLSAKVEILKLQRDIDPDIEKDLIKSLKKDLGEENVKDLDHGTVLRIAKRIRVRWTAPSKDLYYPDDHSLLAWRCMARKDPQYPVSSLIAYRNKSPSADLSRSRLSTPFIHNSSLLLKMVVNQKRKNNTLKRNRKTTLKKSNRRV